MRRLTRRWLLACAATGLVRHVADAADRPDDIVRAIYRRVASGNGDGGGQFVWLEEKDRQRYFSRRTLALWRQADAKVTPGDSGPIDFDPVTNSQDPLVKAFDVAIERQDENSATVVVHISDQPGPVTPTPQTTLRYHLVRENGRWAIDDVGGTIDTPWSLRKMLAGFNG